MPSQMIIRLRNEACFAVNLLSMADRTDEETTVTESRLPVRKALAVMMAPIAARPTLVATRFTVQACFTGTKTGTRSLC